MQVGLCVHHTVGPECAHVSRSRPPAVSKASGLISFETLLPGCSTSCMPSYTAKYTPKLGQSLTRVTAVPLHSPACCAYSGVPFSQPTSQSVIFHFTQYLEVWGVEPVVLHHTPWLESTGVINPSLSESDRDFMSVIFAVHQGRPTSAGVNCHLATAMAGGQALGQE